MKSINKHNTTMRNYWIIDGDNNEFATLREAKSHIWLAYTDKERQQLDGETITHVVNERAVGLVFIYVNGDGKATYSSTITGRI